MAHLGVLCYHGAGHRNPLVALSRRLVSRGHTVTFFLPPVFEAQIREQGLSFFPIGVTDTEPAHRETESTDQSHYGWTEQTRARLRRLDHELDGYIREYLAAVGAAGVDALLMGEIALAGPIVAEVLRTPYFAISTSIPREVGWDAPRALFPYRTWQEELESRMLEVTITCLRGPVREIVDRYRGQAGLGDAPFPPLAHITQWPKCLDVPCQKVPRGLFYTGPFVAGEARSSVEFPWHKLNGRPLVYASLGTTRKADPTIYHHIAAACAELEVQLVVTLGGGRKLESLANLPGDPLVVENAPQLELLKRADLVITHAGPNTVLETLLSGKPMLALPLALDQPAVAYRLDRLGVAEVLCPQTRSVDDIRRAIVKVRANERYQKAAETLQIELQSLDGTGLAASIIEEALASHQSCERGIALQ